MTKDVTYCANKDCPFVKCDRHYSQLKGKNGMASFADFGGTCRKYISYLLEEDKNV